VSSINIDLPLLLLYEKKGFAVIFAFFSHGDELSEKKPPYNSQMSNVPAVDRILIYPIKSLEGVAVPEAGIVAGGGLRHDREFALFDSDGKWINGKRDARIHRIRAEYNLSEFCVTLRSEPDSSSEQFYLSEDRQRLEEWFSGFFGFRVHIRRNEDGGFPDDTQSPGPTIISSATLDEVGSWFGIVDREEVRRRFRANIELRAVPAFWEDRLYGREGEPVVFRMGEVVLHGVNPCQRCAVPSRNSRTGVVMENFQRRFAEQRAATLPAWAAVSRFNHFYRLSVNTRIPASQAGKKVCAGDRVTI
jgi:uncharacterized protein YcbX